MTSRHDARARSSLVDALIVDGRQALRRLVKSPGLSLVVIVTLALAIAANATIFSLLKPTVLRKLNTSAPDAIVSISGTDAKTGAYSAIYLSALDALKSEQRSFATLGAYASSVVRVESEGKSIDVGTEGVTPDYFTVLETRAKAGRLLSAADAPLAAVGVISEGSRCGCSATPPPLAASSSLTDARSKSLASPAIDSGVCGWTAATICFCRSSTCVRS